MLNYNEDIMSVIFRVDNYDENCLYFGECVKNNVKPFSWFSRITYSNSFIALKNIYFSCYDFVKIFLILIYLLLYLRKLLFTINNYFRWLSTNLHLR